MFHWWWGGLFALRRSIYSAQRRRKCCNTVEQYLSRFFFFLGNNSMLSKASECITPKWASPWIAAVQNLNSSMTVTHRWNLTAGVAAYNCPLTDPRTWLAYCLSHLYGKNTKHQNSFLALIFKFGPEIHEKHHLRTETCNSGVIIKSWWKNRPMPG